MSHRYANELKAIAEGKVVEFSITNPWTDITYSTHVCTSLIQGSERGYYFRVQPEKMSGGQLLFKKMYPDCKWEQLGSEATTFYEDVAKTLLEAHTKGELK